MFDGLANEIIQLSEWYLNHPMTKVVLILFAVVFVTAVTIIASVFRKIHKRRGRF